MRCRKFKNLEGCGKCEIRLSDKQSIKYLSIAAISEIVDSLFSFCTNNTGSRLLLEESTISCVGKITIRHNDSSTDNCIYKNRTTCRQFIDTWYGYHEILICDALRLVYISKVSSILGSISSEKEMNDKAMELDNTMRQLTNIQYD